jgi:hypothetical protein
MSGAEPQVALKPIERSLYPPIRDLLINLGFEVVQEVNISEQEKYIDLLLNYDGELFIMEVKVGSGYGDLLRGLIQVYGYSLEKNIRNMIVLVFPDDVTAFVSSISELEKKVRFRSCTSLFLTKSWEFLGEWPIDQSFSELKDRLDKSLSVSKSIEVTSTILKECIQSLSKMINTHYTGIRQLENTVDYLTKKQGLLIFDKRWKRRPPKRVQEQVVNLLAYILINQILFYFLFSKKTNKINPIGKILELRDLYEYFDGIKKINFRPIFDIDVISHVPRTSDIVNEVNLIIRALSALKVEEIRHDLFGRLIGRSMPSDTRTAFSSYYTKVTSSEILARLAIDSWNETIWDTACGSGTILVSAYNRKLELFNDEKGLRTSTRERERIHKEFLEKQLTGIDYMPFACHLTGLNLSAQNLNVYPNIIRIANRNSLDIVNLPCDVSEAYGDISDAVSTIRDPVTYLPDYWETTTKRESATRVQNTFTLEKPDIVLINPPFVKLQNLPTALRKPSSSIYVVNVCGTAINYWGHFLAHADQVLKAGGKIGAIIPDSFLRGERTRKIREYIITNYSVDYIIRPPKGCCFSEDSEFGDMMIIARKCAPEENHETSLVFLHGDVLGRQAEDIKPLIKKMRTEIEDNVESDDYSIRRIKQKQLIDNRHNLGPFFFSNNLSEQDEVNAFVAKIRKNDFMKKMKRDFMEAGYQLREKERPKESVITRNLGEGRLSKTKYYFDHDDADVLEYFDKNGMPYKKNKNCLAKTFRTSIDVDTLDITLKHDYFIPEKIHRKKSSNLIIPNRIEITSENTHALAFYNEEAISPLDAFIMYMCPKEEAKLMCLYAQSLFFIAQLVTIAKISRGKGAFANYVEIKLDYLQEVLAPRFDMLANEFKTELLAYFERVKNKRLPSLMKQMIEKNSDRIELDLLLSNALKLGYSRSEIERIYETITEIIR